MTLTPEQQELAQDLKEYFDLRMREHEQAFHDMEMERVFYDGGTPISVARLVQEHTQMNTDVTELADVILGTRKSNLMGGGRRDDGLVSDIKYLKKKAQEPSEVRLKIPWTVWTAIITTVGAIVVAAIQFG